jgi:hypothetical protein
MDRCFGIFEYKNTIFMAAQIIDVICGGDS